MNILGIETSCDETAVAVVDDGRRIRAQRLLSQSQHSATGGVVPEVAARAHLEHIDGMVADTLDDAGLALSDIDAIAVTAGPGLIGGVLVGVMTAKAIAAVRGLPLVAVNHLEGHALSPRLCADIPFPYLLLLASGGHCQILIVEGVGQYKKLGATIDDAAGECFDKTARLLGLGYPGGPAIEKLAARCADIPAAVRRFALPRPLFGQAGCDFSFSGLKTAVRRAVESFDHRVPGEAAVDLCAAFQESVAAVVRDRLGHALDIYLGQNPAAPHLVVAGGVAANKYLRAGIESLAAARGVVFFAPPPALCTDNAAMIAWAGLERFRLGHRDALDFPVYPRWPLEGLAA